MPSITSCSSTPHSSVKARTIAACANGNWQKAVTIGWLNMGTGVRSSLLDASWGLLPCYPERRYCFDAYGLWLCNIQLVKLSIVVWPLDNQCPTCLDTVVVHWPVLVCTAITKRRRCLLRAGAQCMALHYPVHCNHRLGWVTRDAEIYYSDPFFFFENEYFRTTRLAHTPSSPSRTTSMTLSGSSSNTFSNSRFSTSSAASGVWCWACT